MYIYGGSTCPVALNASQPPPPCDFYGGYPGPALNDTVVLNFSAPGGPAWRTITAADMVAQQHNPAAFPLPMGVALSVYDPDNVALVVWSIAVQGNDEGYDFRADLPAWSLDLQSLQWSVYPVSNNSPTLPPVLGFAELPVVAFDVGHGRIVAYFSAFRELLLYDLLSGWWTAPPSAENSAPIERVFMAGVMLLSSDRRLGLLGQ